MKPAEIYRLRREYIREHPVRPIPTRIVMPHEDVADLLLDLPGYWMNTTRVEKRVCAYCRTVLIGDQNCRNCGAPERLAWKIGHRVSDPQFEHLTLYGLDVYSHDAADVRIE